MKIQLNETQKKKLAEALAKETALVEQANIAQSLAKGAVENRVNIIDMICDAHGIDKKEFKDEMNFDRNTGMLTLQENVAPHNAKSIKQALKISDNGKKNKSKKN